MSQLRDEAEALAMALELGVCEVAEVVAWSDFQILREDAPDGTLCDVSLSIDRCSQDLAGLLRQLPGTADRSMVERLFVTLIDARLKGDPGLADQVAEALYRLTLAEAIQAPRLIEVGGWAWDGLDLADAGHIVESREQILEQLSAVLHDAAIEAGVRWSVGTPEPFVRGRRP